MIFPALPGNSNEASTCDSEHTILFVDDHQQFRSPVATLLGKSGYRVITANDGNEALQKAREFEGAIHLLLADVEMPGMSGIELAIKILQERPKTKILLISGSDWKLLARKYGWPFLRKPFSYDALRDAIRELLSEQQPGREYVPSAFRAAAGTDAGS